MHARLPGRTTGSGWHGGAWTKGYPLKCSCLWIFLLCRLCLLRYEKELLRPDSWLTLLGKIDTPLNDEQAAAFAGACYWQ